VDDARCGWEKKEEERQRCGVEKAEWFAGTRAVSSELCVLCAVCCVLCAVCCVMCALLRQTLLLVVIGTALRSGSQITVSSMPNSRTTRGCGFVWGGRRTDQVTFRTFNAYHGTFQQL